MCLAITIDVVIDRVIHHLSSKFEQVIIRAAIPAEHTLLNDAPMIIDPNARQLFT
jgi:hypothetical protein